MFPPLVSLFLPLVSLFPPLVSLFLPLVSLLLPLVSGQLAAAPYPGPDQLPASPLLPRGGLKRAVVDMLPGTCNVSGTLLVLQSTSGLFVTGLLFGLRPGDHAMHIHEFGRLDRKCAAAGDHFNPDQTTGQPTGRHGGHHGGAMPGRHAGDLGVVATPMHGPTLVYRYDERLRLGEGGRYDVAGLAVIVHENLPEKPRAACGIIRCSNCT